jgi:hypothetical protein
MAPKTQTSNIVEVLSIFTPDELGKIGTKQDRVQLSVDVVKSLKKKINHHQFDESRKELSEAEVKSLGGEKVLSKLERLSTEDLVKLAQLNKKLQKTELVNSSDFILINREIFKTSLKLLEFDHIVQDVFTKNRKIGFDKISEKSGLVDKKAS